MSKKIIFASENRISYWCLCPISGIALNKYSSGTGEMFANEGKR